MIKYENIYLFNDIFSLKFPPVKELMDTKFVLRKHVNIRSVPVARRLQDRAWVKSLEADLPIYLNYPNVSYG